MAVYQPVLTLFLLARITVQQSYHHHSHIHDPPETPYYKYSRAANEKGWIHQDHHEHTHTHDSEDIHHGGQFHKEDDRFHEHLFTKEGNVYKPYDPNGPLSFLNDFRTRLWVYSIGSTLLISIVPFLLLSLIPIQTNTVKNEPLLKILLSFGSGGLLGDAFLHLIPHAQPDDHHGYSHLHQHAHAEHLVGSHGMGVGGYVLSGIITFLTVEKIVRILRSNQILQSHSHSHSHGNIMPAKDMQKHEKSNDNTELDREKKSDVSSAEESSYAHSDHESEPLMEKKTDSETGFKIAAYLNIVADFAHNFTDGLAIGASYLAGTTVGVVTMVTVLLHEVPHEIGDFAILVQSGFSKKRAMFMQLLTACGALSGCMLSLCAADPNELSNSPSSSWVLPFTAGGFIYIATVSVIPELLESTSTWQSIKEVIALLTGILLMYLIAVFE